MAFKFLACSTKTNHCFHVTIENDCLHDAFHELRETLNCTDLSYFLYNEPIQFSGLLKRNNKAVFFVSFAKDN